MSPVPTLVRVLACVVGVALLPGLTAAVLAPATFAARYAPGPDRPVPVAAPPVHDPARPTAVVVLDGGGTEVSDVLSPYETLAATGRFNLYTVAATRDPVPLTGGLDLVPDLTFAELGARTGGAADLVVVPAFHDDRGGAAAFLRAQSREGAVLLAVCNGAGVLASAGLLDGRAATAHWLRIGAYERGFPQVRWVSGRRVVDDGDVVTTGGITSAIDGTLHVVERLAGAPVADAAAASIGWRHHRADPPVTPPQALPDPVAILNAGWRADPATVGVVLDDGVGEIELASVFDVHGGQALAARTLALSADGGPVRSRHGLTFLPRADVAGAAPRLDRLLVPGAGQGARRVVGSVPGAPAPEYPHARGGFAFDATVADLAATTDVATARWTAKALELPVDGDTLSGPAWPWAPTAVLLGLLVVPVPVAVAILRAVRRRTGRTRPPRRQPVGPGATTGPTTQ
ncbi:MAG: DJ-1/PfpI family protein [Pseudonocardiales bacterium]|nr:DJ-1/PfpI family protein [Pseudonocardiales bacterium]